MTGGVSRVDTAVRLVEEHLAAEDRRDVPAVLDTFTDDCIYRIPAYDLDLRGKGSIGEFYASMFRSFPDFVNVSTTVHPSADAIFVEVVTERTHDGVWRSLAPTGRTFRSTSLAQFPIADDGLLGGEIVHVNPVEALYRIGALPSRDLFAVVRRFRPLAGKVALVTGASRGIGAAAATALADAGADIVLAGRDERALAEAAEATRAGGTRVDTLTGDLSDAQRCRWLVEETVRRFGRLDVLVNAAGTTVRGPALESTEEDWDTVQTANLKSVFFTCQAAARVMREQDSGGAIVNIGSLNGVVGNAWAASYAASKGGVVQLTKSLALEWVSSGIRVNAVGPGMVETDMTAPLLADEERYGRLLNHIPMGRFARPEEMGGAVVFLASDASSYMTGQVVYVDGGYLSV